MVHANQWSASHPQRSAPEQGSPDDVRRTFHQEVKDKSEKAGQSPKKRVFSI
jgi:hypothetical protein